MSYTKREILHHVSPEYSEFCELCSRIIEDDTAARHEIIIKYDNEDATEHIMSWRCRDTEYCHNRVAADHHGELSDPKADSKQKAMLEAVEAERLKQKTIWGGLRHDMAHTSSEWSEILTQYSSRLGESPDPKAQLIKIIATAIAAHEALEASEGVKNYRK